MTSWVLYELISMKRIEWYIRRSNTNLDNRGFKLKISFFYTYLNYIKSQLIFAFFFSVILVYILFIVKRMAYDVLNVFKIILITILSAFIILLKLSYI